MFSRDYRGLAIGTEAVCIDIHPSMPVKQKELISQYRGIAVTGNSVLRKPYVAVSAHHLLRYAAHVLLPQ